MCSMQTLYLLAQLAQFSCNSILRNCKLYANHILCNCMLRNCRSLPAVALISRAHKMVLIFKTLIGFTKGNATLEKKVVLLAALKVSTSCCMCASILP
jgi:hypothetical protein